MSPSRSEPHGSSPATAGSQKFDSPEQEVYLNLWRTYDRLKALEDEVFGRFGLSAQQYNALRLLRSVHPGAMPTLALAGRLISRAPDVTRLLDRLEQRGLLNRERRPDNRRVVDVRITAPGLELLQELDAPVQECHQRQLGHLNARSLRELARLLKAARRPHEDAEKLSLVDESDGPPAT
jgi:DNA-binding MarR family transcriptional regulator